MRFFQYRFGNRLFGIRDDGTVIGQDVSNRTIQRFTTNILSHIEPRIYPNIWKEEIEGKTILKVELKAATEKPYFYRGKAYKRVGTTDAYLSRYEIEKYLYERDNPAYHYDKTIDTSYTKGINHDRLKWFLDKALEKRNLPVDESATEEMTLEKLGVLTNGRLNYAGLLSFGKDIILTLPNAYIKCAVFEGLDKTGRFLDHTDIKEDVFRQIDYAENFVLRNIRKSAEVSPQTMRRESRYEVPYRAIRESIANAVAHRDYHLRSTIDIAVFDNRIEIWSPGSLPEGMTEEKLHQEHRSVLRNSSLAELLYLAGYIEHWGTGIKNMKQWMLEENLPEPEYRIDETTVVTILKRATIENETKYPPSTPQVPPKYPPSTPQVLEFCRESRRRDEIQTHLGLKDRKYFRTVTLVPLVKQGLLTMTIPDKPRSPQQRYMITEKGKKWLEEMSGDQQ